jgi:transcription-repair coupling factor (superfamily II helicase)
VLVAALARRLPGRFVAVVCDGVPEAERWLADLESLVELPPRAASGSEAAAVSPDTGPVALYPPREGFGEIEPHAEVAGERVETLERIGPRRGAHPPHHRARGARAHAPAARGAGRPASSSAAAT